MGKWQRMLAMFLSVFVFLLAMSSTVDAAEIKDEPAGKKSSVYSVPVTGDLVPKQETDSKRNSLFGKYGLATFQLDYVTSLDPNKDLKEDCDVGWSMMIPIYGQYKAGKCAASAASTVLDQSVGKYLDINFYINVYNTMLWQNYIVAAFALVKFVSWAFTLEIITIMLKAYQQAMLSIQKILWEPMMYLMWAVAVAWMIYYWISGKKTKLWSTFLNSIIIIGLSGYLFANLPTFLQSVNNASTDVSITILSGLVGQVPEEELANADAKAHREAAKNAMDDNMSGILLDLPYILINFGNPNIANRIGVEGLLEKGYDSGPRVDYLMKKYEQMDDDGKRQMQWMTANKAPERLANSVVIMIFAFAAGICFCIVAALTIIWQFIALGRGLLAAIYLLISLWPEYGMKEAFLWLWSMIQALFMKVFYSIVLAIYIIMVVALAAEVEEMGFLLLWFLAIGMFIGLAIALKELRQKLESIPFGNGVFGKGTTNEAEGVLAKIGDAAKTTAGIGAAVALTAAGMPHGARVAMAVANKGVKGAIKQEATQHLGGGAALKIQNARKERKEKNDAMAEYQERTSGLQPEDAALANHIRDVSGIDVTTAHGRALLDQTAPEFAKNNAEALGRIGQHSLAHQMAKEMPRHMPPPGSLQHEMLARKFGAENVEMWREASANEWESVENKLQSYNNLSLKDRATTPKPTVTNAGIQKQFEKIQLGNRLNENFQQVRVDAKNARGDLIYADFNQFKAQQKNAIGDQVYRDFQKMVAKSDGITIDLNQMPSMGQLGNVANTPPVKVNLSTSSIKQHLPKDPMKMQSFIDNITKQVNEKFKTQGIQAEKMDKPVYVQVDVPVGGGTFGTQKVEVQVNKFMETGATDASKLNLDPSVIREQIKQTLESANIKGGQGNINIPMQQIDMGKSRLEVNVDLSNFISKQTGSKNPAQVIKNADKLAEAFQKSLNFVRSNPDADADAFSSMAEVNKFMKQNEEVLQKQIDNVRKAMDVQASMAASMRERMEEDMENIIKSFKKVSDWQKKMEQQNKSNNPPTPPSGGGSTKK
jgi:hypothetical protein